MLTSLELPKMLKVSAYYQEKSHEGPPSEEGGGWPPHTSLQTQGMLLAPSVATLADMIYGFMSLGRRWSERKTPQQGFPLDVQIKGFRRYYLFFWMYLNFCPLG